MRLPQDKILHIDTEFKDDKVNIVTEWQDELVRCKDCKYRETEDCPMYWTEWIMFEDCDGYTDNNYIVHDYTTDDGYCNYGERKES